MASLDTNGYNSAFRTFVEFAQMTHKDGYDSANAKATLNGRQLTVSAMSLHETSAVMRKSSESAANEATRQMFRNAVIDMFGGIAKVPESVKKAMELDDYGHGRPLTARRILAVKTAIDADGTAKKIALESFASADVKVEAQRRGFTDAELPKLARAAHFYAEAMGVDETAAMRAVAEPNSKANRLMRYGGRFLASAENFRQGLRLMESFETWITAVQDRRGADLNGAFDGAQSFTDLNFSIKLVNHDCQLAFERFVFEDLALADGGDLAETDPEKLFGMEKNAAMRFFGTNRVGNSAGIMANIPPEKRRVVYAAFDKLLPTLPKTKEAARAFHYEPMSPDTLDRGQGFEELEMHVARTLYSQGSTDKVDWNQMKRALKAGRTYSEPAPRPIDIPSSNLVLEPAPHYGRELGMSAAPRKQFIGTKLVIGPILRHLPEVERLLAKGTATDADLAKLLFPDFVPSRNPDVRPFDVINADLKAYNNMLFEEIESNIEKKNEAEKTTHTAEAMEAMKNFACTYDEALGIVHDGKRPPAPPQYWFSTGTCKMEDMDGTSKAARKLLEGDIKDGGKTTIGFRFPDGTALKADGSVHKGNIPAILDKLESLAGPVHPEQQTALMLAVTEAGRRELRQALLEKGLPAPKNAGMDLTFARDEASGAITVKYSSPREQPLRFSWTATIGVDGKITRTPPAVETPRGHIEDADAQKDVKAAAKALGVNLGKEAFDNAWPLYALHAEKMYPDDAKNYAAFIVNLAKSGAPVDQWDGLAEKIVRDIAALRP